MLQGLRSTQTSLLGSSRRRQGRYKDRASGDGAGPQVFEDLYDVLKRDGIDHRFDHPL